MSRLIAETVLRFPRRVVVVASLLALCVAGVAASSSSAKSKSKASSGNLVVLTSAIGATIAPTNGTTTQTPTADVYDTLLWFPGKTTKGGLLAYNYKKFVGELATNYTHKGDKYIFTLRSGVTSCAGNPLTAADVVYSIARAKASPDTLGNPTAAAAAYSSAGVFPAAVLSPKATKAQKALAGEVKALGQNKVEIIAKQDNGLLPSYLTQFPTAIIDAKAAKAHATKADPWSTHWLAANGAGFGPYCLSKWTPTTGSFELTANTGFFYKPGFKKILVRAVSNPSNELAALESGQADVVDSLTPQDYTSAAKASHVHVLTDFTSTLNLIMPLNENIAPWSGSNGVLVRRAVALALPYASIIKNALQGQGVPMYGFIPDTVPGALSFPATFKTNIAKAKALLAQAGYPNGNGLPSAGLQLTYQAEDAASEEPVAIAIQAALAQIGMNIQLNPVPGSQYIPEQFGPNKDLPMSLQDAGVGLYNSLYYIKSWYVPTSDGGFIGVGNYNDPTVNAAYLAAASTNSASVQAAETRKAQQQLNATLPVIPISRLPLNAAIRSNITGVVVSGPGLMYLGHAKRT